MYDIEVLKRSETDRRAFLTRMAAAGLGTAAVALLAGCGGDSNNGSATPDLGTTRSAFSFTSGGATTTVPGSNQNTIVLNFALTLEYLEADLYRQALNKAAGLPAATPLNAYTASPGSLQGYTLSGTVNPGTITDTNLQAAAFAYLVQFAYVEAAHRDFLITALGGLVANGGNASPLQGPTKTYVSLALNNAASLSDILAAIYPLEETGVRAYLGAAKYLQDNGTVQVAASIYSTECRHSAALAYILTPDGSTIGPRPNITGVPSGEVEVASPPANPTIPTNTVYNSNAVFEKALSPSNTLLGASAFLA